MKVRQIARETVIPNRGEAAEWVKMILLAIAVALMLGIGLAAMRNVSMNVADPLGGVPWPAGSSPAAIAAHMATGQMHGTARQTQPLQPIVM
jgi:hypothetical protein